MKRSGFTRPERGPGGISVKQSLVAVFKTLVSRRVRLMLGSLIPERAWEIGVSP